jgi:UDP-N-acetylglucosamine--N-acetylmuramyl-(pentapeptide) pyrophosphoryl-undecaprenol N-acetylglucosamine transferase
VAVTIVLAAGGSAGHVEPALAVARVLRERGHRPVVLGTREGLEARLVPDRGYPLRTVPKVPLPRRPGADLLRLPARLSAATKAALRVLAEEDASGVVGFGGYVCVPAYLAARRRHLGIVVHEANPLPGFANRLGARLTRHVAVSVPGTRLPHAQVTGLPLRPEVTGLDRLGRRTQARADYGLDASRPTLLVTGGSQGARRLNQVAVAAATRLAEAGVQVLHVTGREHEGAVRAALPTGLTAPYVVLAYADDMPAAYAAADLAVCRAGALTCAELAAVGLPAVYVPLPIGNGEQRRNAEPAVAAGGGRLVEDPDLTTDRLLAEVLPLLRDPQRLDAMATAARRVLPGNAADRVALLALTAAGVGENGGP